MADLKVQAERERASELLASILRDNHVRDDAAADRLVDVATRIEAAHGGQELAALHDLLPVLRYSGELREEAHDRYSEVKGCLWRIRTGLAVQCTDAGAAELVPPASSPAPAKRPAGRPARTGGAKKTAIKSASKPAKRSTPAPAESS
jgi:hypothetical protein